MALTGIVLVILVGCLSNVWSLTCYSCFSYVSHNACENGYNVKEIECKPDHDTCVKFNLTVTIAEDDGDGPIMKTRKAFARYCAKKSQCENNKDAICQQMFLERDAKVSNCRVECCNKDLEAACHKRPGWPGLKESSSILTNNMTDNDLYKGKRSEGAQLTSMIWSLVLLFALVLV